MRLNGDSEEERFAVDAAKVIIDGFGCRMRSNLQRAICAGLAALFAVGYYIEYSTNMTAIYYSWSQTKTMKRHSPTHGYPFTII